MRDLQYQRGLMAGFAVSLVLAAALAARSASAPATFVEVFIAGLVATALVALVARSIDRRRRTR